MQIQSQTDEDLKPYLELLARNVHNQWMSARLAEGWVLGDTRNDLRKEHPSLIPYELLSEAEKEYDRQTALTTIRSLLACGFEIRKSV